MPASRLAETPCDHSRLARRQVADPREKLIQAGRARSPGVGDNANNAQWQNGQRRHGQGVNGTFDGGVAETLPEDSAPASALIRSGPGGLHSERAK